MAADTFSALLGFIKQGTGNNNNTWGALLNTGMIDEADIAIAGRSGRAVTGGTLDLSASPPPAGPSGAIHAIIDFSGTLASNQIVQVPNLSKVWLINNACTLAGFTLTFKTPTGAASAAIPVGWAIVWCDGSNNIYVGLSTGLRDVQWLGANGVIAAPGVAFLADPASGMTLLSTSVLALIAGGTGIKINSAAQKASGAPAVAAAGSGYAVGDRIYLTGGIYVLPVVLTVATLSGSGVATVSLTQAGLYSTTPANAVAQGFSSGGGTGATFNVSWTPTMSISDASDATLLTKLGASSFSSTLLQAINGIDFAAGIGSANIVAAIATSLPLPIPQGYLTPTSNLPVILADVIASTQIFYTPKIGAYTVIHNGTGLVPYQFTQMVLNLTSSQAASGIYDVYLAWNGGTPVIGTGPSWSAGTSGSVTPGSCARGTGVGGAALTRLNGVLVNAASMSLIWNTGSGNTTITVPANQGIYLGTIFVDAVAGQVTCHVSYGQSRKFGVWNPYSQRELVLKAGDSSAPWLESTATVRPVNNSTANSLTVLTGLADGVQHFNATGRITDQQSTSGVFGVGYNSTTAMSGMRHSWNCASLVNMLVLNSSYVAPAALGLQTVTELVSVTAAAAQFNGTETSNLLVGSWWG